MAGLRVLPGPSLLLHPHGPGTGPSGLEGQLSKSVSVGSAAQKAQGISFRFDFYIIFQGLP